MNEYASARMADVLRESGGYEPTENPEEADLLLLNTCSVREQAQERVFSPLGRWRGLKAARPHVMLGGGGCRADQGGEGCLQGAREAAQGQDPGQIAEGFALLFAQLLWLLVTFIGDDLAMRQVARVWPEAPIRDKGDLGTRVGEAGK